MSGDICVLHWPDQAEEANRMARLGTPRLLLVEPGVAPPTETSCLVDWQRLPADDQDVHARLTALVERASRHPTAPIIDEDGGITHRGTTVFLSRVDEQIAKTLIERLGHPVPAEELISRVWAENGTNETLRGTRHQTPPSPRTVGARDRQHQRPRLRLG